MVAAADVRRLLELILRSPEFDRNFLFWTAPIG